MKNDISVLLAEYFVSSLAEEIVHEQPRVKCALCNVAAGCGPNEAPQTCGVFVKERLKALLFGAREGLEDYLCKSAPLTEQETLDTLRKAFPYFSDQWYEEMAAVWKARRRGNGGETPSEKEEGHAYLL